MLERIQLNLRLDGRRDLLDAIKIVAASEGLSANAFIVKVLEGATATETATTGKKKQPTAPATTKSLILEPLDTKPLDTKPLDTKPLDTKPLDTKPLDTKPLDTKPLDNDIGKPSTEAFIRLHNEILDTLRTENESLKQELETAKTQLAEWDKELNQLHERNGDLGLRVQTLEQELEAVKSDRPEIQESVPAVAEFSDAADILNQLRIHRKKSRADLVDIEVVLDILENH